MVLGGQGGGLAKGKKNQSKRTVGEKRRGHMCVQAMKGSRLSAQEEIKGKDDQGAAKRRAIESRDTGREIVEGKKAGRGERGVRGVFACGRGQASFVHGFKKKEKKKSSKPEEGGRVVEGAGEENGAWLGGSRNPCQKIFGLRGGREQRFREEGSSLILEIKGSLRVGRIGIRGVFHRLGKKEREKRK